MTLLGGVRVAVRFRRAIVLGLGVSAALAAAYVAVGMNAPRVPVVDTYAFTITGLVASLLVVSYLWRYRDVSETAAFAAVIGWSLFSGLEDVFVYLFLGRPVPAVLPWLNDTHIGTAAALLGFQEVTRTALFAVIGVSGGVAAVVVYGLYRLEAYGL